MEGLSCSSKSDVKLSRPAGSQDDREPMIQKLPLDAWIEAWDSEGAIGVIAQNGHLPNGLGVSLIGYFRNDCFDGGSRKSGLVKFDVAVAEHFGIAAKERIIGRAVMKSQCRHFCSLINLQNRNSAVIAGRRACGSAYHSGREQPVISIVE